MKNYKFLNEDFFDDIDEITNNDMNSNLDEYDNYGDFCLRFRKYLPAIQKYQIEEKSKRLNLYKIVRKLSSVINYLNIFDNVNIEPFLLFGETSTDEDSYEKIPIELTPDNDWVNIIYSRQKTGYSLELVVIVHFTPHKTSYNNFVKNMNKLFYVTRISTVSGIIRLINNKAEKEFEISCDTTTKDSEMKKCYSFLYRETVDDETAYSKNIIYQSNIKQFEKLLDRYKQRSKFTITFGKLDKLIYNTYNNENRFDVLIIRMNVDIPRGQHYQKQDVLSDMWKFMFPEISRIFANNIKICFRVTANKTLKPDYVNFGDRGPYDDNKKIIRGSIRHISNSKPGTRQEIANAYAFDFNDSSSASVYIVFPDKYGKITQGRLSYYQSDVWLNLIDQGR